LSQTIIAPFPPGIGANACRPAAGIYLRFSLPVAAISPGPMMSLVPLWSTLCSTWAKRARAYEARSALISARQECRYSMNGKRLTYRRTGEAKNT
jgi:hypothetical protein